MNRLPLLLFASVLLSFFNVHAQISIPSATPVTQNFDSMGTATGAIPANWRSSAPGNTTPTWATGTVTSTTQAASSGSPATGGFYNWGDGTTTTDRALGYMTSGGYANPSSLMAWYQNTSGVQINDLSISFNYERYRINSATASVTFFTSTDGTTWTAQTAGDSGAFSTGASSYTFSGGTSVSKTVTLTGINIAAGGNFYLRWNFNTSGTNSQGIGLDNVSLTATLNSGYVSATSGNWATGSTWVGGVAPGPADDVTILSGHMVTVAAPVTRNAGTTTTVNSGGTLQATATYTTSGTTSVAGKVIIGTGGWATGTNFTYSGTSSTLVINAATNYGVNNTDVFWPAANAPYNVTVGTAPGITIGAGMTRSVDGNLSLLGAVIMPQSAITINGTCAINANGYFSAEPLYGASSNLIYQTGGTYGRGYEWNANGVGTIGVTPGYPNNVIVQSSTILNYPNGVPLSKAIAGNLTVTNGTLDMSYGGGACNGALIVGGNVTMNGGTLTLGNAVGDDLKVGGANMIFSGTFNGNNRAVFFTRNGSTALSGSGATVNIPYIVLAPSSGSVTVSVTPSMDLLVSAPLGGSAISFSSAADILSISTGRTLTIGTAGVNSVITGSGTFSFTTTSNLSLLGIGSISTINLTGGAQTLSNFTVNRSAIACSMGGNLTVNGTLTLTSGIVNVNNNYLSAATISGGSATSYVMADIAAGSTAALRKPVSAIGTYILPVGDISGNYSPVSVTFGGSLSGSGYVSAAVTKAKHPNLDATANYITRWWNIATSGITPGTFSATATYLAADVVGTEANFQSNRWNGSAWTNGGSTVNTAAHSLTIAGLVAGGVNQITAGYRDQDINIVQGATTYLSGSTYDFGTVVTGSSSGAITFTIQNLGQNLLSLGLASPTPNTAPFSYGAYSAGSFSGPLGTRTFTVTFAPTGVGTFNATLTIPSNDPDENPYTVYFTGTAVAPSPEINIKGFTGGTNNITSGSTATSGLNNTLFAATAVGGTATKDYEIQNVAGATAVLTLSGSPVVSIGGLNPGDFAVTTQPASTSIAVGSSTTFIITFSPLMAGTRIATVSIANNDTDENPYTFNIEGTGTCATATNVITPASGPEGTEVTINASANNLNGATATFNGVAAAVTQVSSTQIKVIVPAGATSGVLTTTNSQGCMASNTFTVITGMASGCQGGNTTSDLFISEVTDATSGGLTYVEIYNATGAAVNLSSYSIQTANNGGAYGYVLNLNNVSLPNNSVYVVSLGSDAACGVPGGDGSYANQAGSTSAGVNFTVGGNDHIALFKGAALIDSWGTFGSATWADGLGLGDRGATFRRKNTATPLPAATFNAANWDIIDWPGTGGTSCSTNDYSDIGTYNFISGTPPTVTLDPSFTPSCHNTALTVAGTEGFAGGNPLAYQWYAVAPGVATWTTLTNSGVYSGATSATLTISNIAGLDGYQYYCQIRENGATCYSASDAVMIHTAGTVTWNGSAWSPSAPTSASVVVINGNYDTAANGSFSACSVTVNTGFALNIAPNDYVSIQTDLTVNASASLTVQNSGSLVMVDDTGVVTNNGTMQVKRTTSPYNKFDYTYWSSPVTNAAIGSTFTGWRTDYAFQFVTANYADVIAPFDGFDDDQNAWVYTPPATTMTPGKGYAVMAPTTGTFPATNTVTFSGKVNNGVITMPIAASANPASLIDDFNLVGNPYPSAIYANTFINLNPTISGTLYFWTHRTAISGSAPGPDANNFITADYAMYNLSGGTSSGTGSSVPTGYIASCEGFFVEANTYTNVVFNNSMRSSTYANNLFYRPSVVNAHLDDNGTVEKDRIWLNFQSADGLFSQQLIAYFDHTTLGYDQAYDGLVSQTSNTVSFYSFIDADHYRIQARPSFDIGDIVPLGYSSNRAGEYFIAIDHREGQLNSTDIPIYLEDKLLNVIYDLRNAPYTFTTAAGVFNDRFQLRYTNGALGNGQHELTEGAILAAANQHQLTVRSTAGDIASVAVYDMLGRELLTRTAVGSASFTTSMNASDQALVVRVTLTDGTTAVRKIAFH